MKKQLRTYPKPYIYTLYSPHAPHEALLFTNGTAGNSIPGENYDYEQDTPLFYDCSHHPELLILPFLYQPL